MGDEKEYFGYISGYDPGGSVEKVEFNDITFDPGNDEIKRLQDINKNFPVNNSLYYDDHLDGNIIYNDGFPSYRMVSTNSGNNLNSFSRNLPNEGINNNIANNRMIVNTDSSGSSSSNGSENFVNRSANDMNGIAEAIKELTSRLPMPPSPDLLKSVHPELAVKLQLTYLKAYIQNQQLLMDLTHSNTHNMHSSSVHTGNGLDIPNFGNNLGSNSQYSYPIVEIKSSYPQLTNTFTNNFYTQTQNPVDLSTGRPDPSEMIQLNNTVTSKQTNTANSVLNNGVEEFGQNNGYLQLTNYPQFANYPNFYYQPTNQLSTQLATYPQLPNYPQLTNYPQLANYPQWTNYPQLTNYPHITESGSYDYSNRSLDKAGEFGYDGFKYENPADLVPTEYRDRVKYNSAKKSFVSVYLNSLGLRKRKSFSINKFGIKKALKLAINFANSLTTGDKAYSNGLGQDMTSGSPRDDAVDDGVKLAIRERNLIEDVCEQVLKTSEGSVESFEGFERALGMARIRGLVYSLGANVWMCIFYKKRKRKLQFFSVDEFGFEKAFQMGQNFFNTNPQLVRSKLSGAISYWLESNPSKTLNVIFKIKPNNCNLSVTGIILPFQITSYTLVTLITYLNVL
eukprot:XP_766011.1 hypothetical protein [Theileria parva strain Muguga]